jgi:hypothetical protein
VAQPESNPPYKVRTEATDFVRSRGVPIGKTQLAELAALGRGPQYSIINGRALYREADLLAWIETQAQQPTEACKRGRGRPNAAATAA